MLEFSASVGFIHKENFSLVQLMAAENLCCSWDLLSVATWVGFVSNLLKFLREENIFISVINEGIFIRFHCNV